MQKQHYFDASMQMEDADTMLMDISPNVLANIPNGTDTNNKRKKE
jgi:hypothetical protein